MQRHDFASTLMRLCINGIFPLGLNLILKKKKSVLYHRPPMPINVCFDAKI